MKKNYSIIITLILLITIGFYQISLSNKMSNLENSMNQLMSEMSMIRSNISQQNYQLYTEKADYILDGVKFLNGKMSEGQKNYQAQMQVNFSKMPSNATCTLEIESTPEHYSVLSNLYGYYEPINDTDLKFSESKKEELMNDGNNVFNVDLDLKNDRNYKLIFVIQTADEVFRETLGIIPVLEMVDPLYNAEITINSLSIRSPDNGTFNYGIKLFRAIDSNYSSYFFNDKILLFLNDEFELPSIDKASYVLQYDGLTIKEGELKASQQNSEYGDFSILFDAYDSTTFTADLYDDYNRKLKFIFTLTDVNGKTKTFEKGLSDYY